MGGVVRPSPVHHITFAGTPALAKRAASWVLLALFMPSLLAWPGGAWAKPEPEIVVSAAKLVSITIEPGRPIVPIGGTVQFRAIGLFSDGREHDVTEVATWSSTDNAVSSVSDAPGSKGLATGLKSGKATISATYRGIVGVSELDRMPRSHCRVIESFFFFAPDVDGTCEKTRSIMYQFAHENDVLAFRGQDHFYTGGTFYEQIYLGDIDAGATKRTNLGFNITHLVYTSSSILLTEPKPTDRPFAGLLTYGFVWEQYWKERWLADYLRVGVDFGCIGPCSFAEAAQTVLHDLLASGSATPQGWRNQVPTQYGANLGILWAPFTLTLSAPVVTGGDDEVPVLDMLPLLSANAGSFFSNTQLGLRFRLSVIGRMQSYFSAGSLRTTTVSTDGQQQGFNLHLFSSFDVKRVGHNALLQGALGERYPFEAARIDRTVRESSAGVAFGIGWFGFQYTYTVRSSEIADAPLDDDHAFGRIQLSFIGYFH